MAGLREQRREVGAAGRGRAWERRGVAGPCGGPSCLGSRTGARTPGPAAVEGLQCKERGAQGGEPGAARWDSGFVQVVTVPARVGAV